VLSSASSYFTTVAALIAGGISCFYRISASHRRSRAERGRRVLVQCKGLGRHLCPKGRIYLKASFSVDAKEDQQWQDDSHFSQPSPPGPQTLARTIQENAFWSKHRFSASAGLSSLLSLVYSVIRLVALLLLSPPGIARKLAYLVLAQILSYLLMFLITVDLSGNTLAYRDAARDLAVIDNRLDNLMSKDVSIVDVVSVFGDYNAAVQDAPLMPTFIYKAKHDQLDRLWRERRQGAN